MNALAFTKYHGNGNDFIIFDLRDQQANEILPRIINRTSLLCHRHRGIGADGILLLDGRGEEFSMTIINADGSVAGNCGNGLRCAADYLLRDHPGAITIRVDKSVFACARKGDLIEVGMGRCLVTSPREITLSSTDAKVQYAFGDIGNKHTLFIFDRRIEKFAAIKDELVARFSDITETNIGFLFVDDDGAVISRVFERGVGWTNSCGTGACVAAALFSERSFVVVKQPGGDVHVRATLLSSSPAGDIFDIVQSGEAQESFRGICQL